MNAPVLLNHHRTLLALCLSLALAGIGHTPPAAAATQVLTPDPRVHPASGTPCVVQLMDNQPFSGEGEYTTDNHFAYMPPPACRPPWAKVVLQVDLSSSRHTVVNDIGISLGGIRLFHQAAPRYDLPASWHAERDLTDYSRLFTAPHTGSYWTLKDSENIDPGGQGSAFTGSARLLFYPPTTQTPAPRVPDAVVRLDGSTPVRLPHNIVRAYLDVENAQPWWYLCLPDEILGTNPDLIDVFAPGDQLKNSIFPQETACGGGGFREIRVDVDGTPAGVAPVFPLLPADPSVNYLRNALNVPTPTLQMLNIIPYRVDLSPFSGGFNAAGLHVVSVPGVLLLYLDRNRTFVSGGIIKNTLTGRPGDPTYTSTLTRDAQKKRLQGTIRTRQSRQFEIRGFVNTSRGRIDSSVRQSSDFDNSQSMYLTGPHQSHGKPVDKFYEEVVSLQSTTNRTSRRTAGTTLLGKDVEQVSYPLAYTYQMATTSQDIGDGWAIALRKGTVKAVQHWLVDTDHYRPGQGHYVTHLDESFAGSRTHAYDNWDAHLQNPSTDTHWGSVAKHLFSDNFGSCFQGSVVAREGAVVSTGRGAGCPGGHNQVRWFAHPDGSPDSLGWWH
ncbi:hypothetical protein [Frateuria soli]|uniref:hypothetical protein n=1 Tax=Frateuria soli TaxID=1542730 RepID=UPI001E546BF0|nr:hypothetical protein [Frateuria soli]UGB36865.1 hypothetical protein LQ771_08400 [Frateuria soli]